MAVKAWAVTIDHVIVMSGMTLFVVLFVGVIIVNVPQRPTPTIGHVKGPFETPV